MICVQIRICYYAVMILRCGYRRYTVTTQELYIAGAVYEVMTIKPVVKSETQPGIILSVSYSYVESCPEFNSMTLSLMTPLIRSRVPVKSLRGRLENISFLLPILPYHTSL